MFFGEYYEPSKPSSFHLKSRHTRYTAEDKELNESLATWLELDSMPNKEGSNEIAALFVFPGDIDYDETIQCSPQTGAYVYKPVDRKIKPVPGVFPEDARVTRTLPEDPLKTLLPLPIVPPDFLPTAKISEQRVREIEIN